MSAVAEIEAALPELSPEDLRRVEAMLHRVQSRQRNAPAGSGTDVSQYRDLDPLIGSWRGLKAAARPAIEGLSTTLSEGAMKRLKALDVLQARLALDARKADAWVAAVQDTRR